MSFFIAPPSEAAQISFSEELELLNVDGNFNNSIDSSLELSPGSHVLVVRYRDLFEGVNADESSTWVKSQPLFLKLVINSKQITLAPPKLDDVNAANSYLKQPYLTVTPDVGANKELTLQPMTSVIANVLSAKD
ncbi:DUF2057 domain-containing protein [Shewanella sp. JBTF-M18]|uniref:DUF2057 domain-containing protein n=2 Tax=Shewanellaceae TaxID=267890 RepID=A0A6L7HTR7_9GAMM|nr:DUF2057 domain-containing protein [Shewanella insulae]